MKYRFVYFSFAILVTFLILSLLNGCGMKKDEVYNLMPTNELILYFPENLNFQARYLKAMYQFKMKYPSVNITVKKLGDADSHPTEQYQTALKTDLMAGSGPDVIFTEFITSSLYKAIDSGAFLNLNSIISEDSEFEISEYNEYVMSAGYYNGRQYIMPTSYTLPILLGARDTLNTIGFDLSKANNTMSFINECTKVLPALYEWDVLYIQCAICF